MVAVGEEACHLIVFVIDDVVDLQEDLFDVCGSLHEFTDCGFFELPKFLFEHVSFERENMDLY